MLRLLGTTILALLAIALGACEENTEEPIRIGINPWPGYEFLFLAREMGFFEEEGVAVELVELSSLGDVRRAFERGQVDGMASTLAEVIQADERSNREPRVFLLPDSPEGANVVIANGKVRDLDDLKGKRIAAQAASLTMFIMTRMLDRAAMAQAMEDGEIDVAVTCPPFSFELQEIDEAHVIFTSAEIPGEILDTVSLAAPVLEARREDVTKIIRAWDRTLAYAEAHPEDSFAIMARRQGISVEDFRESVDSLHMMYSRDQVEHFAEGGPPESTVQRIAQVLRATGQISGAPIGRQLVGREPIRALNGS